MMRQLDFWGISGGVLEQVTESRTPKVAVLRPFFTVAQESYFNYFDRPWEEVRQHYALKYSFELPAEAPQNREAIVLDWAGRCFRTSPSADGGSVKASQNAGGKSAETIPSKTGAEDALKDALTKGHADDKSDDRGSDGRDAERDHALAMKAQEKESKILADKIKEAKDRIAHNAKTAEKIPMSNATFATGVAVAYAGYYREQEMCEERATAATENARLTKELAHISDELGRSKGPPRRAAVPSSSGTFRGPSRGPSPTG